MKTCLLKVPGAIHLKSRLCIHFSYIFYRFELKLLFFKYLALKFVRVRQLCHVIRHYKLRIVYSAI